MYFETYSFESSTDFKRYEFYSDGPRGTLKNEDKEVQFDVAAGNNNNDLDKILITVANIVIDFMLHYPTAMVMAAGDIVAKTRLYQMKINKYLVVISAMFAIQGYYNKKWENFRTGKNYDAFLVLAKEDKIN